jgi:hypothetical protein
MAARQSRGNSCDEGITLRPYWRSTGARTKRLFLIPLDLSSSMKEPYSAHARRSKLQVAVELIHGWLNETFHTTRGFRDYLDIGVMGYKTRGCGHRLVESLLSPRMGSCPLQSVLRIAQHPVRTEFARQQWYDDQTGEFTVTRVEEHNYVDPAAGGGRPMQYAFRIAHQLVAAWVAEHPGSFPPMVINITCGPSQDGSPALWADRLKSLCTRDGNVLLHNQYLPMGVFHPLVFPDASARLRDSVAREMFRISSVVPELPWFNVFGAEYLRYLETEGRSASSTTRFFAIGSGDEAILALPNILDEVD